MTDRIIKKDVLEGRIEDNTRYGLYVLRKRVLPSVRDGLKAVQRRIIYASYALVHAVDSKVKTSKTANVVTGELHPHGNVSVSGAFKPLTNWFEIQIPLLDGQGNWGGINGDREAADRYTESKLSKFSLENFFDELRESKEVVDWIDTYSFDSKEPEYLPSKVPILLINGNFGIAVGLKNYIPKHNINEVIDATVNLIHHPNADVVLIPDQCQECEIVEANWKKISNTGSGRFIARGKTEVGTFQGYPAVFIKSTPDLTFSNKIIEKINKLIEKKKITEIKKIYDKSSQKKGERQVLNVVIQLKKGVDPNYMRDILYNICDLQQTFSINFEALDGYDPERFSYKSYLEYFIEFRRMTKFRLYANKIQEVTTKLNQLNLYIKVIKSGKIKDVINMITKYSKSDDNLLMEYLIKELGINDIQALYIMNTSLKNISIGNLPKFEDESKRLTERYNRYTTMITNEKLIDKEIIDELLYFKRKYGRPRKCTIISAAKLNNIPEGEFKLVITENNFIKKIDLNSSIGYLKDDSPKLILKVDNTKSILLFDEKGKVFKLDVHKIPLSEKNSNGIDIRMLLKNVTSDINAIIYEPVLEELSKKPSKYFLTIISRKGIIKKMDLEDFLKVPPSGIYYAKLDNDDIIKAVSIVAHKSDIIVYSDTNALRMNLSDVPHLKRNSKGNKAMSTDDPIDGLAIVYKKLTTHLVVITKNGYINKMSILALPCNGRFKEPSNIIKLKKGDSIKSIFTVNNEDGISIMTKNNKYYFKVKDLEEGSSVSSGKKMINNTRSDIILKCKIKKQ